MFVYLDNSATTKQLNEVSKAMAEAAEESFGNPSSLHRMGMKSEKLLKDAVRNAAAPLHADDSEIFFTSGGTESDNTAIFGIASAMRRKGSHIITTAIEHPAVLECCKRLEQQGFDVTYMPVDRWGMVNPDEIKAAIRPDTILISVMSVNNELGTIQPLKEIALLKKSVKDASFTLHCDHVQGYGKISLNPGAIGIDLLSISGHKFHGPKGTGALYVKKGTRIDPFIYGGGQERGFRSGTENVPGYVGLGIAARHAYENFEKNRKILVELKEKMLKNILDSVSDVRVNSPSGDMCAPGILNVSFMGIRGEVLLHMLEQDGIYISTGSACSSHKKGGSHVLKAAGLNADEIEGAVRISFSEFNTAEEIDFASEKLAKAVQNIRKTLHYGRK